MRYDLVIFDNDGVLVDSEPISNRILAAYLTELGHPTTYEDSIRDYMGSAMHRIHDLVLERTGRVLPAGFDDEFHTRVFDAFRREPAHDNFRFGIVKTDAEKTLAMIFDLDEVAIARRCGEAQNRAVVNPRMPANNSVRFAGFQ